jgi:hypothetical protein
MREKEESLVSFHGISKKKTKVLHPTFIGGVFFVHILELVFVLGLQRH